MSCKPTRNHISKCGKKFQKIPSGVKPGGTTTCPKCRTSFIDKAVVEAAESFAKRIKALGID